MKHVFLSAAIILLCLSSLAQKVQFTNPTNVWSFRDTTTGCCIPIGLEYKNAYYDSTGSVTYNGHNYQSLVTIVASFLVREDSGKVYVIGTPDSIEHVLYDFNVGLGDTMRAIYPTDTLIAWVSQLDSTLFGGQWYKVWHFDGKDCSSFYPDSVRAITYNVIEGIGCTNGLYFPVSPYSLVSFSEQMLCFTNDMHIASALSNPVVAYGDTFISYYDNDSSCMEFYAHPPAPPETDAIRLLHQANSVLAAPNPINDQSKLLFPYSFLSGTVLVINEVGQIVVNMAFSAKEEILIGDRIEAHGLYYYRVTDDLHQTSFSGTLRKD